MKQASKKATGWQSRLERISLYQRGKKRRWYRQWWGKLIIIAMSLAALWVLLMLIYFLYRTIAIANQIKKGDLTAEEILISQLNSSEYVNLTKGLAPYYLGTSTPKVVIVEYGDHNCQHCRSAFPAINDAVNQNLDKVQYIWRNWPGQENSELLAQAPLCAGLQVGELGYWLFHNYLLTNQGQINNLEQILALTKELDLMVDEMATCLEKETMKPYLQKDFLDAMELGGIEGTPTWFINGYRFTGELPLEFFNYMINELTQ